MTYMTIFLWVHGKISRKNIGINFRLRMKVLYCGSKHIWLLWWSRVIFNRLCDSSCKPRQYHTCWSPGSLYHQQHDETCHHLHHIYNHCILSFLGLNCNIYHFILWNYKAMWINSLFLQNNSTHKWLTRWGLETHTNKSGRAYRCLTHWGRVTHICVGNLTIIGSENGLSPGRRQAIIWTNARISLIGPLGTNSSEILGGIITF